MKQIIKSLLIGGALVAASASQAAIVNINVYNDAPTAEAMFLSTLHGGYTTEDFESAAYEINPQNGATQQLKWEGSSSTFVTSVGSFTLPVGSDGYGDAAELPGELKIESEETGEYGRQVAEGRWLDSNDAKKVVWDISVGGSPFNAIGFYLLDANDQGARLTLTLSNGLVESYQFNTAMPNGNQKYITIVSDTAVASATLTFDNGNVRNDGWGIDNVTVGNVPEPGTLLLMGLGLLGLGAARRRTAA